MKKMMAVFAMVTALTLTSSADSAVVSVDIARAKSIAVAAIKEKYPDADPAALQYTGLEAKASTNDEIAVFVNYLLTGSGTTEDIEKNGIKMSMTKQTGYVVKMDTCGQIKDVSTQSSISTRSSTRNGAANKPSEGAR